jgi:hypothetical protein
LATLASTPVVTNLTLLEVRVDSTWINTVTARIQPPGAPYNTELGVMAFTEEFDTNFIAALTPTVSDEVPVFSVKVVETNTTPRERLYYNSTGGLVQAVGVPSDYNPTSWIVVAYGSPPSWLNGSELAEWYADRDPSRQTVTFSLVASSNLTAYETMLTNRVQQVGPGQSSPVPKLELYSNDIAMVGMTVVSNDIGLYLHAPPDVSILDLFVSTNLAANEWFLLATLLHDRDPLFWTGTFNCTFATFALANGGIDSDGDGISDARETFLFETDPHKADTDNDGLNDGAEYYRYGLNGKTVDTDLDGLPDGWEVQYGLNPTVNDASADTDNDGFNNAEEYKRGMNPLLAADGQALYLKTRELIAAKYALVMPSLLVLTNAPGSALDRQDLSNALNAMSGKFKNIR